MNEDTISRKAAIDYFVTNVGFNDEDGYPIEDSDELRKIWTEFFYGIPSAERWIPVTERLPEKYGQYLVTFIPSGGTLWTKVLIAFYSDLMGIAKPSFHIGEVGKDSFVNINEQVIAWMPLPEPYKGGAEE